MGTTGPVCVHNFILMPIFVERKVWLMNEVNKVIIKLKHSLKVILKNPQFLF